MNIERHVVRIIMENAVRICAGHAMIVLDIIVAVQVVIVCVFLDGRVIIVIPVSILSH